MAKLKRKTNPYGEPMSETFGIRVTPIQKEFASNAGTADQWRELIYLMARAKKQNSQQQPLFQAEQENLQELVIQKVKEFIGAGSADPWSVNNEETK